MTKKRTTLRELEVLAIDCQATHSNPLRGHILEIGWVRTRASAVADMEKISRDTETFLLKIPRNAEIPRAVWRITGIPNEELRSAQAPKEIWQRLSRTAELVAQKKEPQNTSQTNVEKMTGNLVLDYEAACPAVIHFCRYEEPFLRDLHKKFNPNKEFPFAILCTHEIVKKLLPGLPRKSLRAVAGYFGQSLPESRRSLFHVVATALIWHHLVKLLEDNHAINTFFELREWLRQSTSNLSGNKFARVYPMSETYRRDIPNQPGVYRMYRSGGELLYVGKAKSLRQRVSSYFHKGSRHPEHVLEMLSQAQSLDTTITRTSFEAALVESDEIKRLSPPYNRALQTNDRSVLFFSLDLKQSKPHPDRMHTLGPIPSSRYIDPLVMLGDLLNGRVGRVSLKVIETILDIPSEYLPDRDCFVSGVKIFNEEFQKSLQPAFDLTAWMTLGARFWKEKLEEQTAEQVAKKEALEKAAGKATLEGDTADEQMNEAIFELQMQESEDMKILDTWTPERIVGVLKSIIRLGAFQVRRSRWFCRLSESSLVWTPAVGDPEVRNLVVFKGGTPLFKDPLFPSEAVPSPPGHKRPLLDRQKNFDLLVFDRMRVATTEIRRLIQEGRSVELRFHPDVLLRNEQLKNMLQWL